MAYRPHNHANGKTPWQKVGLEVSGFVPAEFVSMGVSLGVVAMADRIAPAAIDSASKVIGKIVFEPYLESIEKGITSICSLKECQADESIDREKRAQTLAKTTLVFGAAWIASMIAKMKTRRFLNNLTGVSEAPIQGQKWWQFWKMTTHEKIIFGMDEGVHYGSFFLFNRPFASVTDDMIEASKNVLVKLGVPETKAHEISMMGIVWELPNFLGLMSGIGGIMGIHHRQWDKKYDQWRAAKPAASHVQQLLSETAHITPPQMGN